MRNKFKIIDLTYLDSVTEGDNELIKELIEIFISQIPEFISQMNDALKNKNWYQLGLIAHKAKSSVAVVGMKQLSEKLKQFEIDAKEEFETETYTKRINDFCQETSLAINELNDFINQLKKS